MARARLQVTLTLKLQISIKTFLTIFSALLINCRWYKNWLRNSVRLNVMLVTVTSIYLEWMNSSFTREMFQALVKLQLKRSYILKSFFILKRKITVFTAIRVSIALQKQLIVARLRKFLTVATSYVEGSHLRLTSKLKRILAKRLSLLRAFARSRNSFIYS